MRRLVYLACIGAACLPWASTVSGEMFYWNASSGVLPSDLSIPAAYRFDFTGQPSFVSLSGGILNINDTANSPQVGFVKRGIDTIPVDEQWAFQAVVRMNSHSRTGLDWGADIGIIDGNKTVLLLIAEDTVGFAGHNAHSFVGGVSYAMDTTDSFHSYRVVKGPDVVSLFVDSRLDPVLIVTYSAFGFWTENKNAIMLAATSNLGVANYDMQSFACNLKGTEIVPVPGAALLGTIGVGYAGLRLRRIRG